MRRDEHGATAVIVAILMVSLTGFGALTIDVGALVQERRELQNGADSATLALAKDCGLGTGCGSLNTTAESYADANADDADSDVTAICGAGPGTGLTPCAPPPPLPTGTVGHVQVTTSTREASSGTNQITYTLAQVLTGTSGHTVTATAAAAWGYPGGATVAPITFSMCEYNEAIAAGGLQSGPPFTGSPSLIHFHGTVKGSDAAGECQAGPAGSDLPGGFGWLETAGCQVAVDINADGGWVNEDPGNDMPAGCDPSAWYNTTLLLPIYDTTNGLSGSNGEYHILGFAALYVTGYRFSGSGEMPSGFKCPPVPGSSGRCIAGYFTNFVTSGTFGGPNLGSVVVKMVS